jgi:2-haloacid dehalogenase
MSLTDFKALTFDCYGTLIDWESGMVAALRPLTRRVSKPLTRNEILEAHARHESAQQRQTSTMRYADLLAIVYKRMAEDWGVPASWDECVAYGQSVGDWPAFPDTAPALAYLKQHYKLIVLSNVDNASFARTNAKLGVTFDAICTAEDIGSYKPSPRNFAYLFERLKGLGVSRQETLHVAESLFHDHVPANEAGLTSCWIYRRHDQEGFGATMNPGRTPDHQYKFTSMAELADAHRKALQG